MWEKLKLNTLYLSQGPIYLIPIYLSVIGLAAHHEPSTISRAGYFRAHPTAEIQLASSIGVGHLSGFAVDNLKALLLAGPAHNNRQPLILLDHQHLDQCVVAAVEIFNRLPSIYINNF